MLRGRTQGPYHCVGGTHMGVDIGRRIRERRARLGWTQDRLAKEAGIPRPTLANYEAGRREPDLETVQKLAHALNTSMSYLVGETDDPSPPPRMGIAAHREGVEPGEPLEARLQLIIERAVREAIKERDEWLRKKRQGDASGGPNKDGRA